jgi:hypothetical protein
MSVIDNPLRGFGSTQPDHNSPTFWTDAFDFSNAFARDPYYGPVSPLLDVHHRVDDIDTTITHLGCTTTMIQWVADSGPYGGHYEAVQTPCENYTPPASDGHWQIL